MPDPRDVIERWYGCLASADLENFAALHADDVVYNSGGRTHDGDEYVQNYAHFFTVENGLIVEVWELFDTELAQARLFGKPLTVAPEPEPRFAVGG